MRTDMREYPTVCISCLFEGDCLISFNCILLCHLPVAPIYMLMTPKVTL